jgi:hypothetical protein
MTESNQQLTNECIDIISMKKSDQPVSRDEENSREAVDRREHVGNVVGGSVDLAEDEILVGRRHLLRQLRVNRVELLAVLALGREHEQDGVLFDLFGKSKDVLYCCILNQ